VKIYTGCDHAGFALRNKLLDRMRSQGHEVVDFGTNSEAACDYPEFAALVANAVRTDVGSVGVLVCATGHGTAIAAGKVRGIRAFAPSSVEAARLSRFDNNTNVLCLGSRILAESDAFEIVDTWLSTGFAGGRHGRRIAKIAAMETAAALNLLVEGEHLRLAAKNIPASIWARDAAAFAPAGSAPEGISHNLGWLDAPSKMEPELAGIAAFAAEVRKAGFRRAVLLGMGGSALPAEVLARIFGPVAGWLNVFVLDSTDPAAVAAVENSIDIERTLFVVASKSGSTPEVFALERYFWAKVLQRCGGDTNRAGGHFAAITDAGTELEKRASSNHYRRVFGNPPDISSRFSALASFGLVPAALMGVDVGRLVARGKGMASACREPAPTQNPGVGLGTLMAALAAIGRDKLTLFLSPELAPLGAWIEQLVAGVTGKQGRGIVPVEGEPPFAPSGYRSDRFFVVMRLRGGSPAVQAEQLEAIITAGHPVYEIELGDKYDLGAEFFRWEFAAVVAASLLEVNPFDEFEVVEARLATTRLLDGYRQTGKLASPSGMVDPADAAIVKHLAGARPGDYLAICAYFQPTPEREQLLSAIRALCGDRLRLATTVGYGPRCLHVAGQLHKGGAGTGIFLQLHASVTADLPIPGEPFSFGVLRDAEGLGDLEVLQAHGRRVLRVDCGPDPDAGLAKLLENLRALGG
jgi:RpiB/LacA/LacB family sugar-phosphate isomerase